MLRSTLLASSLTLFTAGCGNVACMTFESPLTVGQQFGPATGQSVGDVVLTESNISAQLETFHYASTGTALDYVEITGPVGSGASLFGNSQLLRFGNANLIFDFSNLSFPVKRATFDFGDFGGNENLAVNGGPVPPYRQHLTTAPSTLNGATVNTVFNTTVSAKIGIAAIEQPTGAITTLLLGGQELWIDKLCAFGK